MCVNLPLPWSKGVGHDKDYLTLLFKSSYYSLDIIMSLDLLFHNNRGERTMGVITIDRDWSYEFLFWGSRVLSNRFFGVFFSIYMAKNPIIFYLSLYHYKNILDTNENKY